MLSFLLASALCFTEADAGVAYATASNLVETCTPRDAGTKGGKRAADFLCAQATLHGAKAHQDSFTAPTPIGDKRFTNVVAEWQVNATSDWIVVVSHYDTKSFIDCPGANDGASTSGLLIALSDVLSRSDPLSANFMLMWLDGEESMHSYGENDGFWGSKHAAAKLRKSGRSVKAVICVDMLGDADLGISIPRNTSASLRRLALKAANEAGYGDYVREMREFVKDDHVAFMREGFPAIDLIDFEYGSAPGLNDYWHTPRDTIDKISTRSLLVSGQILCRLINAIAER